MADKKALVIDDDEIVLDSVSTILQGDGFRVDISLSSRKGLEMAIRNDYDVVLTDIRMPEIGGMRVLRDVKRAKPSVPVMIITGYATVQSAVQAMKLGACDYMQKPFTPEELLARVSSAIEKAATTQPEDQSIIHKDEVIKVLERAAYDGEFHAYLLFHGSDALDEYVLTGPEKLSILTGDVHWIEEHLGKLTPVQRRWLEQRLSAEIW